MMNYGVMKFCAWCGIAFAVLIAVGFIPLAGFLPPPSPNDTATQTAAIFINHATGIRFGMLVSMFASCLLLPFTVAIALHMQRIEGQFPALAMIEFGMGTLFVLEFIYILYFWLTATFRADRSPELIQLMNDMGWIPFIGITGTLVSQAFTFGFAIFIDKRTKPIFPRWLGYYNFWAGLLFLPGTINVFFHTGPFAWDGSLAFYLPITVFLSWMIINSIFLIKAADHHREESTMLLNHE